MKGFLIIACILVAIQAAAISDSAEEQWQQFKLKYNRQYETEAEEHHRKGVFLNNLEKINAHNKKHEQGIVYHTAGVNNFADKTAEELISTQTGFKKSESSGYGSFVLPIDFNLPDSIDWREYGFVTAVKNQRDCGSCWAYSATGALEGQLFRKNLKLVSLSEQNLVDCSYLEGNDGCRGGDPWAAFEYVIDNGGIDTEESYPYEDSRIIHIIECRYDSNNSAVNISTFNTIKQGSEKDLQGAVANIGPISAAIHVTKNIFTYTGGIYEDEDCKSGVHTLNHAVLVVGYGFENGKDYWIVKNSWGIGFGELGYMRISRNNNNHCGIASHASYPIIDFKMP